MTGAHKGKIDFVVTTARGHRSGRRRSARPLRHGLLAGRRQGRGRVLYGVRRGRTRFIAVVPFRQAADERRLVRRLQAAGLIRVGR